MRYLIRLAAEVGRQHNWRGTRRRVCTFTDGPRLVVFTRVPIELDELPPEVEGDPLLLVTELSDDVAPSVEDLASAPASVPSPPPARPAKPIHRKRRG